MARFLTTTQRIQVVDNVSRGGVRVTKPEVQGQPGSDLPDIVDVVVLACSTEPNVCEGDRLIDLSRISQKVVGERVARGRSRLRVLRGDAIKGEYSSDERIAVCFLERFRIKLLVGI